MATSDEALSVKTRLYLPTERAEDSTFVVPAADVSAWSSAVYLALWIQVCHERIAGPFMGQFALCGRLRDHAGDHDIELGPITDGKASQ